jgi:AraC family transcriptional regulator of adaptative response/methylated-DNA-[protein]-cysteine methyltransferase
MTTSSERTRRIAIGDSRLAKTNTMETAAFGGQVRYAADDGGAGELVVNRATYGPNGAGARVAFTTFDSPFGRVLIATTRTGVCWLGLCDSDVRLEAELRADLPAANLSRDPAGLAELARIVVDYVSGRTREIAFSLDLRTTPFQLAVWRELCSIPRGATRSYREIALRLGQPNAARAVGRANGSNPLAIIIPCHRAIGTYGSLTGYRWGLEYKRRLLDHESFR